MFTLEDLIRIMRECAGEDEEINLEGDIADTTFGDLGYDSLAVLETTSMVARKIGVPLSEDFLADIRTPGQLVALVQDQLQQSGAT